MERVTRTVRLALVLSLLPAALAGQTLDRVDQLVRDGRIQEARAALLEWSEAHPQPDREERQRELWFRGVLTLDPAQAASAYRRLAVEFPGGSFTDLALHRLGTAAALRGDLVSAAGSFETLARDYPGSSVRGEAVNWLSRNRAAVDSARAARAQDAPTRTPPATGTERVPPRSDREPQPRPPTTEVRDAGAFAAQLGAFTTADRAEVLATRVREAGFEPRIVRVPGSEFFRVRAGRFTVAEEARAFIERLRQAGFDAGLATDADREREVR